MILRQYSPEVTSGSYLFQKDKEIWAASNIYVYVYVYTYYILKILYILCILYILYIFYIYMYMFQLTSNKRTD